MYSMLCRRSLLYRLPDSVFLPIDPHIKLIMKVYKLNSLSASRLRWPVCVSLLYSDDLNGSSHTPNCCLLEISTGFYVSVLIPPVHLN